MLKCQTQVDQSEKSKCSEANENQKNKVKTKLRILEKKEKNSCRFDSYTKEQKLTYQACQSVIQKPSKVKGQVTTKHHSDAKMLK